MSGLAALVLAGSRGPGDPLALSAGVSHKALIPVGGVAMLRRVLDCLCRCPEIARIAVSIERPDVLDLVGADRLPKPIQLIPAAGSPSLSVARAVAALGTPLFVTTADHPLLEPAWVSYFLAAVPPGADIAAALARAELVQAAAPETRRTYLHFADGRFSGCNLFYLANERALGALATWKRVEAHRKNPLRLVGFLGPLVALNYALGRLSLREALDRLGQLGGMRAEVVDMPFGRAAIDVDKPSDLVLAEALLRRDGTMEADGVI